MRTLAILSLALALLGLAAMPAAHAQTYPSPSPSPTTSEPAADGEKPPPWDIAGRAEYNANSWVRSLVVSALDPILRLIGRTILATPQVDRHPRVRELWKFSLVIANAALVIFVLAGAGIVMVGGLFSQLTVKELLPRISTAALTVNLGLLIAGQLIGLANALTLALLGAAADPAEVSMRMSELVFGAGMEIPLFLLFALAVLVLAVLVVVAYVIRVAVLVVLLAGGPLFLITHSLPQTDQVARMWWRLLAAMIASPILQALVLTAAVKVFFSGEGVFGVSGGGLIDLLVVGCLLYLLYRIPIWTINVALRGAGSRALASAKQQVVVAVKSVVAA